MNKSLGMLVMLGVLAAGCSTDFWGGGATGAGVGVAGTGAAYELNARKQMQQLDADLQAGRINQHDYDIRKDQLQKGSLVY